MDIWPDGIVRHLCIPVLVPWHQEAGAWQRDVYGAVLDIKIPIPCIFRFQISFLFDMGYVFCKHLILIER